MQLSKPKAATPTTRLVIPWNKGAFVGPSRRTSEVHVRALQHYEATLSVRLSQPGTVRGLTRPAGGQSSSLIPSTTRGALQARP